MYVVYVYLTKQIILTIGQADWGSEGQATNVVLVSLLSMK